MDCLAGEKGRGVGGDNAWACTWRRFDFFSENWKKNAEKKLVFSPTRRWFACTFEKQPDKLVLFSCMYIFGDYTWIIWCECCSYANKKEILFLRMNRFLCCILQESVTTLQREHYEAMLGRLMTFRMRTSTRFVLTLRQEWKNYSVYTHMAGQGGGGNAVSDATRVLFLTETPGRNFHIVVASQTARQTWETLCVFLAPSASLRSVSSYKCVINSECIWLFGDSLRVVTWCRSIIVVFCRHCEQQPSHQWVNTKRAKLDFKMIHAII